MWKKIDESRRIDESYDSKWSEVGAAFDEFRQRLWEFTRKDMNSRRDEFSLCMNKCEEALKEYADMCVFD